MGHPREINIVLRARMHQGSVDESRRLRRGWPAADEQAGAGHGAVLAQALGIAWRRQQILARQAHAQVVQEADLGFFPDRRRNLLALKRRGELPNALRQRTHGASV